MSFEWFLDQKGFKRLIFFGIDADFAYATNLLVRLQDKSNADFSLTACEVQFVLDALEAMFGLDPGCQGAFDLDEGKHTYHPMAYKINKSTQFA